MLAFYASEFLEMTQDFLMLGWDTLIANGHAFTHFCPCTVKDANTRPLFRLRGWPIRLRDWRIREVLAGELHLARKVNTGVE